MFARLTNQPESSTSRFILWSTLLIGFLTIGIALGTIVNGWLDRASETIGTDEVVRTSAGAKVEPPYQVQNFTLTSHTGEPLSLSDLRGNAVLMFFGYTHCPDVCPTTLADYRQIKADLDDIVNNVKFVFISVDGVRDTPAVMAEYLNRFDSEFIGLTGNEYLLRQIGAEYGLLFESEMVNVGHEHEQGHVHDLDEENYFVQHTSPSFLIDPDGYLRMVYFYGTEQKAMIEGIRQMLQ